ncbi:MAG: hypothetical protein KJ558_10415 [Gammaproteobacteria bacterium]|nr:hypothetical protein [Gammaproteobacteria bacterium]MBU1655221.1 hypothetical protein [Gammaproteobacteria bacterium]MBU1960675.1 hypothetical protein [Gammaproteobacteria bacterium]
MIKPISAALALSALLLFASGTASAHPRHHNDAYRGDYSVARQYYPRWERCGRGYEFFRGRCYWVGYPDWRDDRRDHRHHRHHRHGR